MHRSGICLGSTVYLLDDLGLGQTMRRRMNGVRSSYNAVVCLSAWNKMELQASYKAEVLFAPLPELERGTDPRSLLTGWYTKSQTGFPLSI